MSGCPIVTVAWLHDQFQSANKLSRLVIFDCSSQAGETTAHKEAYSDHHIPGAHFFDINVCRDKTSSLCHMLPQVGPFNDYVRHYGVDATKHVILYDSSNTGFQGTPRVWWIFKIMTHKKVSILDGGLKKWELSGFEITSKPSVAHKLEYNAGQWNRKDGLILQINDIKEVIREHELKYGDNEARSTIIIDARPFNQFTGYEASSQGLQGGYIRGSVNIQAEKILFNPATNKLRKASEIRTILKDLRFLQKGTKIVVQCNYGLDSPTLLLAFNLAGKFNVRFYDGGWEEITKVIPEKIRTDAGKDQCPEIKF